MSRLIDADALIEDVRQHSESYFADDFAHEWVDRQPTIDPQQAIRDAYKHGKSKGIKKGMAMAKAQTPCDVCRFNPPSSADGKPCTMCPAEPYKGEQG